MKTGWILHFPHVWDWKHDPGIIPRSRDSPVMLLVLLKPESRSYAASPRNAAADVPECLLGRKRQTRAVRGAVEIAGVWEVRELTLALREAGEKWTGSETMAALLHPDVTLFHFLSTVNPFARCVFQTFSLCSPFVQLTSAAVYR